MKEVETNLEGSLVLLLKGHAVAHHTPRLGGLPILFHHLGRKGGREGGKEGGREGGDKEGAEGGSEGGKEGGKEGSTSKWLEEEWESGGEG